MHASVSVDRGGPKPKDNRRVLNGMFWMLRAGTLWRDLPASDFGHDPTPSQADIQMTKAIIDIATPLGISVHDHIIVGKNGHASLKGDAADLEHDPEKCVAVFRKDHAQIRS